MLRNVIAIMNTKTKPISAVRRPTTSRFSPFFVLLAALALVASACGSDPEEIVAGSGGEDANEQVEQAEDETSDQTADESPDNMDEDMVDEDHSDDGMALTPSESHPELVSGQPALISEVVTIDDQTLGVRYEGAAEPCAMANVTVTETDASVEVALETGLNPNAAAMSCIAQVFNYEIQVSLDQPIGDREVIVVAP